MSAPSTIAVDLTPVLPGGANGGAKPFALELVRGLAAMSPSTRFVLFTQAASHEELAALDAANVRREMLIGPRASSGRRMLFAGAARAMRMFPRALQELAATAGYGVNAAIKRGGLGTPLRDAGADLLYCPFTAPTYREPGIPTVCTVYDLQYRAFPHFFAVEDAVQRRRAFEEACAHATRLAAISDFTRAEVIAAGNLDPARIATIPLRMGVARVERNEAAVLARLGLRAGGYLIYPANFWKHKNHELLLEAFAGARREGLDPGMRLVLTGADDDRRRAVEERARALGVHGTVVLPGYVPEGELAALVADARALVFPSLYEGFGLPVIEAMARGVPVACSDAAALPEVAGDAALLFDPRDVGAVAKALGAICGDAALRARLAAAGLERARGFSDASRMAGEYWALFLEAAR